MRIATKSGASIPALKPSCSAASFSNGSSLVVFADENSDGNTVLFEARKPANAGWSNAQPLGDSHQFFGPVLAMLPNDRVLIAWVETKNRVLAREFSAAVGWGPTTELRGESDTTMETAGYPQILADERGNALVLWYMDRFATKTGRMDELMASAYEAGTWSLPMVVAQFKNYAHYSASTSKSGRVLVSWRQELEFDQKIPERVWVRSYTMLGTFDTPATVSNEFKQYYTPQSTAIDDAGNAVAMWLQPPLEPNGNPELWTNQLVAGSGWSEPVSLGPTNGYQAPSVSFDSEGRATAIWSTRQKPDGNAKLVSRTLE